jgi:DNA topoisomerase-2
MISNKVRFILMVVNNELIINMKQKKTLCKELKSRGFATKSDLAKIFSEPKADSDDPAEPKEAENSQPGEIGTKEYDYLLGMALWALTMEEVEKLKQEKLKLQAELETLKATSVYQLWEKDLDDLKAGIEEVWLQQEKDLKTTGGKKPPKKKEGSAKKKTKKEKENRKVAETATNAPKQTVFDSLRAKIPALNKVENLSASNPPASKQPTPTAPNLPNRKRKAPEPIVSDSIEEIDMEFEL